MGNRNMLKFILIILTINCTGLLSFIAQIVTMKKAKTLSYI